MDPFALISTAVLNSVFGSGTKAVGEKIYKHASSKKLVATRLNAYLRKVTDLTSYFVAYRASRQHVADAYVKPSLFDTAVSRLHLSPVQFEQLRNQSENLAAEPTSSEARLDKHPLRNKKQTPTLEDMNEWDVKVNRQGVDELVLNAQNLLILADAGDGKTSLLGYLCWARLNTTNPRIPVFADSRDLQSSSLLPMIQQALTDIGLIGENENGFHSLQESLSVYIDGLDELSPEKYSEVNRDIIKLAKEMPGIQLSVTCRSGAYRGQLSFMHEVTLAPFTLAQAEEFISSWYVGLDDATSGTELIGHLRSSERVKELASKPLLLALMCNAFRRYLNVSRRPTALFDQCVNALLWEWDAQRDVRRQSSFSGLDHEKKYWLHSLLAAELHNTRTRYCPKSVPLNLLESVLPKFGIPDSDAEDVLTEMCSHYSIFVKWAEDTYGFCHLALQEFLAAKWYRNDRRWQNLIKPSYVNDSWWHHVIAYCLASMDDGTEALKMLLDVPHILDIERMRVAAYCLKYEPVVDEQIRDSILRDILAWYHNGDASHTNAATQMLVGMEDEWTAPVIRRSLAGSLPSHELAQLLARKSSQSK